MIAIMSEIRSAIESHERGRLVVLAGRVLFSLGDKVVRLHRILSGEIILERHSAGGLRLILQRARSGDVLAEPSIFAERYHCSAMATSDAEVAYAPVEAIRSMILQHPPALERLARQFARDVQSARFRAEILSLRRLSDRLDAWLDINDGVLPDRGNWLVLAADLAVTPEALYRELAKRRSGRHSSRDAKAFRA
jgi:CRP-like cAMP-binding protein